MDGFCQHSFYLFVSVFIIVIHLHLIIDTTSCILGRFWKFTSSTHLFTAFQSIDIFLFPYPLLPLLVAGYKHYDILSSSLLFIFDSGLGIWHHHLHPPSSWIIMLDTASLRPPSLARNLYISYFVHIIYTHTTIITTIPRDRKEGASRRG